MQGLSIHILYTISIPQMVRLKELLLYKDTAQFPKISIPQMVRLKARTCRYRRSAISISIPQMVRLKVHKKFVFCPV